MPWYAYAVLLVLALASASNVLLIGRPREPIDPATALATLIFNGLMAWAVIALALD